MAHSILGTRVQRTEDPDLLRGAAKYLADLDLPQQLHMVLVRSEMAHARIVNVDTEAARALPGVVAVYTAADLDVGPHMHVVNVHADFVRHPLAVDTVRFVGDPVAVVIAGHRSSAADGAAAVVVEYESLPTVIDAEAALANDAPLLFAEHGSNIALQLVDTNRVDLESCSDTIVRGRFVNQRMAAAPMEPNGCTVYVDDNGRLCIYASTQMPHMLRDLLAAALGIAPSDVRVITPAVGGGFGAKIGLYHEFTVCAAAARRLGQPVVWTPTRSDDMVSLLQSRGQVQYAELGCSADGHFTGLRVHLVGDAGAYPTIGAFLPAGSRRMAQGPYAIPRLQYDIVVAATNTTPMGAYRGAGRPEATALIERLVDHAARELEIDPVELRLRNLLPDDSFPFRTLTGVTYDSGRYALPLRTAVEAVGYQALRAEQASRRERGDRTVLGIGVSAYVEITAGGTSSEFGAVEVHDDGSATVRCGTSAHGQGHRTSFAMIVSAQTGIPVGRIRLIDNDTDLVRSGAGTGGSRSLQVGGSAVHRATEAMVAKARSLAAHLLEADPADIDVDADRGVLAVRGVPARSLNWGELAAAAVTVPAGVVDHDDGTTGLAAQLDFDQTTGSFPFGAHISVVEVDLDTGLARVIRHVAVDDCGTVLNPLLVEGQQHGGIAAGIGQALYEHVRFDDDGNPLTSTLMDYTIASAAELPLFETISTETPTPLNPLGAKGIGEAATIGATPAVQNAVIDALSHLGVRHIDMPCTPERVWEAIRTSEQLGPVSPWRDPPPWVRPTSLASGEAELDAEGLRAAEGA